jgi:heat shock protein HslJ
MPNSASICFIAAAISLLVAGCTSPTSSGSDEARTAAPSLSDVAPQALGGVTWALATLGGDEVTVPAEQARPTVTFDSDAKRVSGLAAVNRFNGTYSTHGGALTFGPLMATKMAGAPELNDLETRFLRALERTTGWRVVDGELELLADLQAIARFKPKK